nr:hypothetical protein [Tanacetum cinerariifolium]
TMVDFTAPNCQAPTMAPSVHNNDQILPRIRWVQTGYLKFSADGTKREVFGMPIPVDIEKVAVCSSIRSPKSKRIIESRAKRSSKIISLGHDSTLLASSHIVKSMSDIKIPTHYPCGTARTSE